MCLDCVGAKQFCTYLLDFIFIFLIYLAGGGGELLFRGGWLVDLSA